MEYPKISVIVPIYNAEKYLRRCIDSILAQTFTDFELLLIDDGSSDKSGEICDEYAQKDLRVKAFHKKNGGVSSARNIGLTESYGEWISFIDSDDWVDADYLKSYHNATKGTEMVIGQIKIPGSNMSYRPIAVVEGSEMVKYVFKYSCLSQSAPFCKLYSNDIIKKNRLSFPQGIHNGEDGIFFTRYLNCIGKISVIDFCGYNYNITINSLSQRYYSFEQEWDCFLLWKKEIEKMAYRYQNLFESPQKIVWNNRIGDTFVRCIHCIPRFNPSEKLKKKLSYFKSIPQDIYDEYFHLYNVYNFSGMIIKILMQYRFYRLFVFIENVTRIIKSK